MKNKPILVTPFTIMVSESDKPVKVVNRKILAIPSYNSETKFDIENLQTHWDDALIPFNNLLFLDESHPKFEKLKELDSEGIIAAAVISSENPYNIGEEYYWLEWELKQLFIEKMGTLITDLKETDFKIYYTKI